MNALGFDLGNTLMEYAGVPLNWAQHYPAALGSLADFLQVEVRAEQIERGSDLLRRYNTRLNPRETEVGFATILAELCGCLGAPAAEEGPAAAAFFRVFQQHLRGFDDARVTLANLRARKLKLGVFTDVPYGMPRELVLRDIADAGLAGAIDVVLTSRDAGFRKPAVATLCALATALGCTAAEMAYVGDEQKDIEAARRFGCGAILLDRLDRRPDWGQDRTIRSLLEL